MITDAQIGFKEGDLRIITEVFDRFPSIQKALLFGSRAKGNYKTGSDADIALFFEGPDKTPAISGILNDEILLPYKFDLLNFEDIDNPALREHINRAGIFIYKKQKVSENR
ncbi:nucleotidyltransferase domain-containing protein [soil metagenome]